MDGLAGSAWLSRDRVTRVAVCSAIATLVMLAFIVLTAQGTIDRYDRPVGTDFSAFYTAGWLVNEGRIADAWDLRTHTATARALHGAPGLAPTPWFYPPVFLFVASPLASLPYLPALLLWQSVSVAAMAASLCLVLKDRRAVLIALASPFTLTVLAHGQNAYLTAALLGGGLALLTRGPARSGALIGTMVYKPQLGLLLGPWLVLRRQWAAILAAAASAFFLIGCSLLLWGWESWQAFLGSLVFSRTQVIEAGAVPFSKSGSLFGAARLLGANVPVAYVLQMLAAIGAALLLWRLRGSAARLQAAAVCAATALWTPYVQDYDLAIVGVGGAFLYVEARATGFKSWERAVLALIWAHPLYGRPLAELLLPTGPLITLLLTAMVLRRAAVPAKRLKALPCRRSRAAFAP